MICHGLKKFQTANIINAFLYPSTIFNIISATIDGMTYKEHIKGNLHKFSHSSKILFYVHSLWMEEKNLTYVVNK